MKNYAKIGGKKGKPAYRTPSNFKQRSDIKVNSIKYVKKGKKIKT